MTIPPSESVGTERCEFVARLAVEDDRGKRGRRRRGQCDTEHAVAGRYIESVVARNLAEHGEAIWCERAQSCPFHARLIRSPVSKVRSRRPHQCVESPRIQPEVEAGELERSANTERVGKWAASDFGFGEVQGLTRQRAAPRRRDAVALCRLDREWKAEALKQPCSPNACCDEHAVGRVGLAGGVSEPVAVVSHQGGHRCAFDNLDAG
jgi:hypothetical protein